MVPRFRVPRLQKVIFVDVRTKKKSKVKAMEVRAAARPQTGQDRTDGIKVDVLVRIEILPRKMFRVSFSRFAFYPKLITI
jgi:hypothetical protein